MRLMVIALVLGSLNAIAQDSMVPVSCSGRGCNSLGLKQGGTADLVMVDASSPSSLRSVPQSLVISCVIRPENSHLDTPCGPVTLDLKNLDTGKRQSLKFNGTLFTIPTHEDFGRYNIHLKPARCPIAKDIKNVLVGGITTLTFKHCK